MNEQYEEIIAKLSHELNRLRDIERTFNHKDGEIAKLKHDLGIMKERAADADLLVGSDIDDAHEWLEAVEHVVDCKGVEFARNHAWVLRNANELAREMDASSRKSPADVLGLPHDKTTVGTCSVGDDDLLTAVRGALSERDALEKALDEERARGKKEESSRDHWLRRHETLPTAVEYSHRVIESLRLAIAEALGMVREFEGENVVANDEQLVARVREVVAAKQCAGCNTIDRVFSRSGDYVCDQRKIGPVNVDADGREVET